MVWNRTKKNSQVANIRIWRILWFILVDKSIIKLDNMFKDCSQSHLLLYMTFFLLWNIKYDICFHRGLMKVRCNQNCLVSNILNINATEESKSCRFGTTQGGVKHHNIFHFWVNYPFNVWSNIFKIRFASALQVKIYFKPFSVFGIDSRI